MTRDLNNLSRSNYDLLIIGGGVYGACVAWEATLRGLSVGLVEKRDFGSATSANSQKIIHGGFRYLQNVDIKRIRESIRERKILMRIAPHLVHPLPCLIPTYGHLLNGKELLAVALFLYDVIGFDRNHFVDSTKRIPVSRVVTKEQCLHMLPGINKNGLTGAILWYDGQVYNTERLTLSFLLSASERGADIANYAEVIGFLKNGNRVTGVKVKDVLANDEFEIRAKIVINTCGPWLMQVLNLLHDSGRKFNFSQAKAVNLVTRQLVKNFAFGVSGKKRNSLYNSVIKSNSRFFFITPWRNYSIIGTTYEYFQDKPDNLKITAIDINNLIHTINILYPGANLTPQDVYFYHVGLVPISRYNTKNGSLKHEKHYQIYDHKINDGIDGLVSVLGVKYTTARDVAQKTVNLVSHKFDKKLRGSLSDKVQIYGGEIERFTDYLHTEKTMAIKACNEKIIEHLIFNYGSRYGDIIKYISEQQEFGKTISSACNILKAEVVHAVREEMAQKLSDVVFRRTELGSAGNPGNDALISCADIMAQELGWDTRRTQTEIEEVMACLPLMSVESDGIY